MTYSEFFGIMLKAFILGGTYTMRLSTEEKQSLVARYHAGDSVAEICADTGIARSTFYTWIKSYTATTTDFGYVVSQ